MFALVALALFGSAQAETLSDQIFSSGIEPALVINGKVGYPAPLANAIVEARYGGKVSTASTKVDGSYAVAIELASLPPNAIIELVAFGTGASAHLVWASPLGPSDRLLQLAGEAGRVTAAEDPFVNLTPRSTAIAGVMRAFNGYAPISDETTYYRAALSYQARTAELIYALAMVARGGIALPAAASDTFAAVGSELAMQQLYADYANAARDCATEPESIYCVVINTLSQDEDIVARRSPAYGVVSSGYFPFTSTSASYQAAYVFDGPASARVFTGDGRLVNAAVTDAGEGVFRLAPSDGTPIDRYESYYYIDGVQYRAIDDTIAYRIRPSVGPAGVAEHALGEERRRTYPDNPEMLPVETIYSPKLPMHVATGELHLSLLARVPILAGKTFVLPLFNDFGSPVPNSYDGPYGYDLHVFSPGTAGYTQRAGVAFDYSQAADGSFQLSAEGVDAHFNFVNEEEDGVWRVRARVTSANRDQIIDGLLIEAGTSLAFDAASIAGTYTVHLNGQASAGPLGSVDTLGPYPMQLAQYVLDGAGAITNTDGSSWGVWSLGSGAHVGRVVLDRRYPSMPSQSVQLRGWQKVAGFEDGKGWVLENFNMRDFDTGIVAPITFGPTSRLSRVIHEP